MSSPLLARDDRGWFVSFPDRDEVIIVNDQIAELSESLYDAGYDAGYDDGYNLGYDDGYLDQGLAVAKTLDPKVIADRLERSS